MFFKKISIKILLTTVLLVGAQNALANHESICAGLTESQCYAEITNYCRSVGSSDPDCRSGGDGLSNHARQEYGRALVNPPESAVARTGGDAWGGTINNPLGTIDSVEGLVLAILNALIVIAVPIIVIFIIYAGFMYVTARGNAEQIKKATRALTYAIIGAVLVLAAVTIMTILKDTLAQFLRG